VTVESGFPGVYDEPAGLIISGVVSRSHAATVAATFLEKALREQLRHRAAAAYAPWSTYEAVDREHALIAAGSDLLPELVPGVLSTAVDLVDRLERGVPQAWITEHVEAGIQSLEDPYQAFGLAMRAGHAALNEQLPPSHQDLLLEMEQTDPEEVRGVFRELRRTLLLGAPAGARLPRHAEHLSFPRSAPWRSGRAHRSRNWPMDRSRFAAGPPGFEVFQGQQARQIPLDQVVGLYTWNDGTRHIVGRSGWALTVRPGVWSRDAELVHAIDRLVPLPLRLPQPGVGAAPTPRLPWRKRWLPVLRRGMSSVPVLSLVTATLVAVSLWFVTSNSPILGLPTIVATVMSGRALLRKVIRVRRRRFADSTAPEAVRG